MKRDDAIAEINSHCLLMRTRLISRVLTAIYDEELRPLGIGSPQFALLVIIHTRMSFSKSCRWASPA